MENAAWRAACDVWRAEQQARRLAKKFQRYAETVDRRLGPGGMFNTANKGSDLIGEWLVQEVSKAS
jgi:hypothetical protein